MPISILCPHCGQPLRATKNQASTALSCPSCKTPVSEVALPVGKATIELHDGVQRSGWLAYQCVHCEVKVRAPHKVMGLSGSCPACGFDLRVPRLVKLEPYRRSILWGGSSLTCSCGARMTLRDQDREEVGFCISCKTLLQVPGKKPSAQTDSRRPERGGNQQSVQEPIREGMAVATLVMAVGMIPISGR